MSLDLLFLFVCEYKSVCATKKKSECLPNLFFLLLGRHATTTTTTDTPLHHCRCCLCSCSCSCLCLCMLSPTHVDSLTRNAAQRPGTPPFSQPSLSPWSTLRELGVIATRWPGSTGFPGALSVFHRLCRLAGRSVAGDRRFPETQRANQANFDPKHNARTPHGRTILLIFRVSIVRITR